MTAIEKYVFIFAFAWLLVICASLVIVKTTPASMPETRHFDAGTD